MKSFQRLKNGLLIKVVFIILFCFILTSCFEVKQKIVINKNGSGDTGIEIAIQKQMLLDPEAIPKFKNDMNKKGWKIIKEREEGDKYFIAFEKKFKEISELNDDEMRYTFSSQRKGLLKKNYGLEIEKDPFDIAFPYELTIKMPGNINHTNGTKVSSNEVKWYLQGEKEDRLYYIILCHQALQFLFMHRFL
jgi:hypothetical protein